MADETTLRASDVLEPTGVSVRISVLGPFAVELDGRPVHVGGSHRRRLLAFLASRAGETVSFEMIIDAIWDDDPPETALKTLRSHVSRLRQSLGGSAPGPIETMPSGYRLTMEPDAVDAARFDALASTGRAELETSNHAVAARHLSGALELWRGRPYLEFTNAEFARVESVRLHELRHEVIEDLAEAELNLGAASRAVHRLDRLVVEEPGRERAWGLLMRALYASGRQHDALGAYHRARHVLAEEYGLEPSPALREIEEQIVTQDPMLVAASGEATLATALRASTPLVGRRAERESLHRLWETARDGAGRLAVVRGAIDSGRTRLVAELAGLIVRDGGAVEYLRGSEGFVPVAPDAAPEAFGAAVLDALAERAAGRPLLVILDDVEWLPQHHAQVLTSLVATAEDLPILVVLVIDPSPGGAVVTAVDRLGVSDGVTIDVGPMYDDEIAAIVAADGVEPDAVEAITAIAAGLPGVARREAAAWAERTASDRLQAAAASSIGTQEAAARAQELVLDEVVELVAARARRDEMRSAKWAGRQPYRALAAYGPQDAELFVGRERLVAELAALILEQRLVVVVGPSGCGKSSLIRAGLVPLARSGRLPGGGPWRISVIVPGIDPLASLDSVSGIDDPGAQLLVVDQFEEVLSGPTEPARAFVRRLIDLTLDPALDVRIAAALRADALGALTAVPGMGTVLEHGPLLLGPPTDDELRRIVAEPAQRTGVMVEPALVDLIVDDVTGHDAALPLVSVTMSELWEQREGGTLSAAQYVRTGRIAAAIERLGERVVAALGDAQLPELRSLLLSLANITEDDVWERRRVDVDAVPESQRAALDALVDARLVVRGADTLEIVHEVVFRAWPRLVRWLGAARADKHVERDLRAAARAWDEHGRSDDDVFRGARLDEAVTWASRDDAEPSPLMAEFLQRSSAVRRAEEAAVVERLAAQTKSNRRLRRLLTGAVVLLVATVVASALAVVQRNAAAEARDQARVDRLVAESERELDSRLDLAFLLAAEAHERAGTPETRGALWTALSRNTTGERPVWINLGNDQSTSIVPARTHTSFLGFISGPRRYLENVRVSHDGGIVVIAGAHRGGDGRGEVSVLDVESRQQVASYPFDGGPFLNNSGLDLSPDGSVIAAAVAFSPITLIEIASGHVTELPLELTDDDWPRRVRFLSDSRVLVSIGPDRHSVWDVGSGTPVDDPIPPDGRVVGQVSGGAYAVLTDDFEIALWDAASDRIVGTQPLEQPESEPMWLDEVVVSADGATLVASEFQGRLFAWDLATGDLRPTPPQISGVRGLAFQPAEPDVIVVSTVLGGLHFVDLDRGREIVHINAHSAGGRRLDVSVDGETMVSIADDGLVALWGDSSLGSLVSTRLARDVARPMYSADGSRLVVFTTDGGVEVRDGADPDRPGTPIVPPPELPAGFDRAVISADGDRVVVTTGTYEDGGLFVADAATGLPVWQLDDPDFHSPIPGISPDGTRVAVTGGDVRWWTDLRVFDITTGREVARTDVASLGLGDGGFGDGPVFTADGQFIDVLVFQKGAVRLRANDLALVTFGEAPLGRSQGWAAEVPGTDDVIGYDGPGQIARWDMSTGELVGTGRSREASSMTGAAVSPDGSVAAVSHFTTGSMSLFDTETMRTLGAPFPTDPAIAPIQFTADSTRLVYTGPYGEAMSWDVDPDSWQATACLAAGRNLTREEWAEYIGDDEPYRRTCDQWPEGE